LAIANGTSPRLSSVTEGRNGAITQPSRSAMMPIGAIWTFPPRSMVVMIVSRL
jgi:hypothetical protein